MPVDQIAETRTDRRKRRNRQALIEAGYEVMAQKGIDAATMSEIADLADVGAGTVYNYFASKDELAEQRCNRPRRQKRHVPHGARQARIT